MNGERNDSAGLGVAALGTGAALLALVCCAGPALVGAGGLAAVGGLLRSPVVVILAVLLAAVLVVRARRRTGRVGRVSCCPPAEEQSVNAVAEDTARRGEQPVVLPAANSSAVGSSGAGSDERVPDSD